MVIANPFRYDHLLFIEKDPQIQKGLSFASYLPSSLQIFPLCPDFLPVHCFQGAAVCDRCNPGYFQSQSGEKDCPSCPAGFLCEERGTVTPVPCQISEYCPTGSSKSTICPLGFFCEDAAAKMPCASSTDFCPAGSITKTPCPGNSVCAFDVVCSEDEPGATVWLKEPGLNSCPFSSLLRSSPPTQSSPPLLPSPPTFL